MAIIILLLRVNLLKRDTNAVQLSLSLPLATGHVKNCGPVKADLHSQALKTEEGSTDGRVVKINRGIWSSVSFIIGGALCFVQVFSIQFIRSKKSIFATSRKGCRQYRRNEKKVGYNIRAYPQALLIIMKKEVIDLTWVIYAIIISIVIIASTLCQMRIIFFTYLCKNYLSCQQ